jgi:hypothetical protein
MTTSLRYAAQIQTIVPRDINGAIQIMDNAPFGTHISLEYFTHPFPQLSIIARFELKVRNFSQPLTILGAHQDSANYLFPLLPAPGADDDCPALSVSWKLFGS